MSFMIDGFLKCDRCKQDAMTLTSRYSLCDKCDRASSGMVLVEREDLKMLLDAAQFQYALGKDFAVASESEKELIERISKLLEEK